MAYDLLSAGGQTSPKRVYRHDGISATTLESLALNDPSGAGTNVSGVAWDGENVIVARPRANSGVDTSPRFQRYVGFSSTLDSEVILSYNAQAIYWDRFNNYLLSVEPDTDTVRRYDGFTSTVVDSVVIADATSGVTVDDDGNLIVFTWTSGGGGVVKRFTGFSTTLLDSFSHGGLPAGLTWDPGTGNLLSGLDTGTPDTIYVHTGFSSTTTSFASPDNSLEGIALKIPLVGFQEGWGMLI